MTRSWTRLSGIAGLAVCVSFLPMAVVIPVLPDLSGSDTIVDLYRQHSTLVATVVIAASVGFGFLLVFLGGLVTRLQSHPYAAGPAWSAALSAVMFFTALNVALGLAAAARLLQLRGADAGVDALHVGAYLLAAPAAGPGVAFFVATVWLAFRTRALPRFLGWLAVVGAIANVGPVAGPAALAGPLDAGNGLLAGLAIPVASYLVWIAAASLWLLKDPGDRPIEDRLQVVSV